MKIGWLLAVVACGKSGAPAAGASTDPTPLINRITVFANRCDECKAERDCLQPLRDEWAAQKVALLTEGDKLAGEYKTAFDAQVQRLQLCGDGGGVTFWVDH